MRKLLFAITSFLMLLTGCNGLSEDRTETNGTDSRQVMTDKGNISRSVIENVEYFRRFCYYGKDSVKYYEKKHPNSQWDPANFFAPYASRYSLEEERYINSPMPTETQLTVTVETMLYNTDSLFCIALICFHSHYDKIKGIEDACDPWREFDAKAIIGCRDNISEPFKIYPLNTFRATGFESCRSVISCLKKMYFNDLKGTILPPLFKGSEIRYYEYNLNDPKMFSSVIFQKNKEFPQLYNFQLYRYSKDVREFQYFSNQPDSIKEIWLTGVTDTE